MESAAPLLQMTYYAVLQVFAKSNQLPRAEAVFAEMRSKGMATVANGYNMRMNGYGRVRNFEAMERVFGEMQAAAIAPDQVRNKKWQRVASTHLRQ